MNRRRTKTSTTLAMVNHSVVLPQWLPLLPWMRLQHGIRIWFMWTLDMPIKLMNIYCPLKLPCPANKSQQQQKKRRKHYRTEMEANDCRRHMPKFNVIYCDSRFISLILLSHRWWPKQMGEPNRCIHWIKVKNCIKWTSARGRCQPVWPDQKSGRPPTTKAFMDAPRALL